MSDVQTKIKKYIEHYSKEIDRVVEVQKFILGNDRLKEYDTELLSRLVFPIIEELGFCLLGKNGVNVNGDTNTTKCINEVLKEILEIDDEIARMAVVRCFRHSCLHQSNPRLRFIFKGEEYLIGYSAGLQGVAGKIIDINHNESKFLHFRINDLVYALSSRKTKNIILDLLNNNQHNFLYVFNYEKRFMSLNKGE